MEQQYFVANNNMPKVSVCIPTCNRRDFLKETLDSVFSQTYKDYEVVVLDDGSSDGTEQMIRRQGYPVRYFWQENHGEPFARNKLIDIAKGEFITFIDSDDLLFPYSIGELCGLIDTYGSDIIAYGSYVSIDEKGSQIRRKPHILPFGGIAADLFEYIYVHSCGTLCRKELFKEAGGFDVSLPVCSPYALWLELSLKYKFVPASRPIFKRRRHKGNLSAYSFNNRMTELNVLERVYQNGFRGGETAVIEPYRALKRLSREGYRAARCAIKEGRRETACSLLSQSYQRHPNFKSLFWLMIAKARLHRALLKASLSRI